MAAAAGVSLTEVGPRDGLQNEPDAIPTEAKLELVMRLAAAGLRRIEIGSFVAPKWIPQLADCDALIGAVPLLPGVIAAFECAAHARHDGGDHMLFIAEVKRFRAHGDRQPLVFGKGRYAALQPTELAAPLWPLDIHY